MHWYVCQSQLSHLFRDGGASIKHLMWPSISLHAAAPLNLIPVTDFDKIVNELRLQYKRICIEFHVRDGARRPTQGAARMIFNFLFSVSLSFLRLYQLRSSCLPRHRLEYFVVEIHIVAFHKEKK
ncbi:hypothetical protein MTR_1g100355 [Medicago truncatula]|uniref:Uncharacterized protein n=1 Tax=Medicago truncatula TaxID=3880 RepID=A0A072VPU1_MEDTR|nr:hypothetical protein MTR_1g100355 [Medicago truncatula]